MKECDKGNESFRVNFALFRNFTNQKQRKEKKNDHVLSRKFIDSVSQDIKKNTILIILSIGI